MKEHLSALFSRDLGRLEKELTAYDNEKSLWLVPVGISNSGGNLALHLVGNLNHFVGAILGDTGYQRDREGEFNDQDVPVSEILDSINAVKNVISNTINGLSEEDLRKTYPLEVLGRPDQTDTFLIHLYGHLNYHLGQINYHRRLISHF